MPRFHFGRSRSRGRGGGPTIPWYFWGKYRGSLGVCILAGLTLVLVLVDLILAATRYLDEVGTFTYLAVEFDLLLLMLQIVHLVSVWKLTWMVCGYYCQLILSLIGFVFGLAFRISVGITVPVSYDVYDSVRRYDPAVDFMVIGIISGVLWFTAFFIWSSCISSQAAADPEFLVYYAQLVKAIYGQAFNILQNPLNVSVSQPTIVVAMPQLMGPPNNMQPAYQQVLPPPLVLPQGRPTVKANYYPQPPPPLERGTTIDQIQSLQRQLDELKQRNAKA